MDLAAIDRQLDEARATCRVVIECSKGSRTKYTWDHEIEAFELSGMLPAGMSFPLDFGMVPSTLADDGDPIDILVVGDEPAIVGCVVDHVGRWFTNYNALKNKGFDVLGIGDASEAVRLIAAASDVYAARRPER